MGVNVGTNKVIAVLVAASMLGGCSALFQDTLPSHPKRDQKPVCDEGNGLGAVDTVFAVVDGGYAGLAIVYGTFPLAAVAGALVWGASAMYGFSEASKCSEAKMRWHARAAREEEKQEEDIERERAELRAAKRRLEKREAEERAREREREDAEPEEPAVDVDKTDDNTTNDAATPVEEKK